MPEINIKNICGHYEVFVDGHFFCSADTYKEAEKEINNAKKKHS